MRYNVLTGFIVMGRCEGVVNEACEDREDLRDHGIRTGASTAPVLLWVIGEVGGVGAL
jgi:hypothetical protein